jgi:hypothetical protein
MNGDERSLPLPGCNEALHPEPGSSPDLRYRPSGVTLDYETRKGDGWIRVVFDRLDSLRMCRGEYSPYIGAEPPYQEVPRPRWWSDRRSARVTSTFWLPLMAVRVS